MPPLTAAQVLEHPEFESVVWDLKAVSKGRATVAQGRRGGPLDLAYEVHGQGPVKLVVGEPGHFLCPISKCTYIAFIGLMSLKACETSL